MGVRGVGEGGTEEGFGGAVVGRCIECADTEGEGAVDYGSCG